MSCIKIEYQKPIFKIIISSHNNVSKFKRKSNSARLASCVIANSNFKSTIYIFVSHFQFLPEVSIFLLFLDSLLFVRNVIKVMILL